MKYLKRTDALWRYISAIAKLAPNSVIKEGLEVTYSSYDRMAISEWLEHISE